MRYLYFLFTLVVAVSACTDDIKPVPGEHDLVFDQLATTWDEAIPLGNGMLGALVWQNNDRLRISLDRADLWDLRPMKNMDLEELTYDWVYRQWKNDTYDVVQDKLDIPYNERPAPTKIPAGAIEFNTGDLGDVEYARLYVDEAVCEVKWENGTILQVFMDANKEAGWFRFSDTENIIVPGLEAPAYTENETRGETDIQSEVGLTALGYQEGTILKNENRITYKQDGWGGFRYTIDLKWEETKDRLTGCWSISSEFPGWENSGNATSTVDKSFNTGFGDAYANHVEWWDTYWDRSGINIPDARLEKQWYLEMYKFGSAARSHTPPIPLQGVWTADNGRLPPWKGDFHHDLNTQLSYWPAYSSNHLDIEQGFVDWLWKYKPVFEKYTGKYFGSDGLNVPGVTTLTGEPMGGWIQYSMGPTVSAWLGHHFYLHWRYSMDRKFLGERAYPWIKDVAKHFENISVWDNSGKRKLPISSSPEINNNSRDAWFGQTTNFDLALIRWTYQKAAELALELGKDEEAETWVSKLSEWPDLSVDSKTGLMIAPGHPFEASHRHFSHLMAWHPLGIIDLHKGNPDSDIIYNTLDNLMNTGTDWWTGYSFSWLGNLQARALKGEEAAKALRIFADAFCLPNSFHVNGDQSGMGYSKFTYRPFTLEGNFAFASGLQEMLLQSHTGLISVFPAIPSGWKDISFDKLRAEGAFLVSSEMLDGEVVYLEIHSGVGEECSILNPFDIDMEANRDDIIVSGAKIIRFTTEPGETIIFKPAKE